MRKFLIVVELPKSKVNNFFTTNGDYPTESDIKNIENFVAADNGYDSSFGTALVIGVYELSVCEGPTHE